MCYAYLWEEKLSGNHKQSLEELGPYDCIPSCLTRNSHLKWKNLHSGSLLCFCHQCIIWTEVNHLLIIKWHSKIYLKRILQKHEQKYFFPCLFLMKIFFFLFFFCRNCSLKIVVSHLFGKNKIQMAFNEKKLAWNWKKYCFFPSKMTF